VIYNKEILVRLLRVYITSCNARVSSILQVVRSLVFIGQYVFDDMAEGRINVVGCIYGCVRQIHKMHVLGLKCVSQLM